MKKFIFLVVVIMMFVLVACGISVKPAGNTDTVDIDTADQAVDSVQADTDVIDEANDGEPVMPEASDSNKHYYKTVRVIGYADAMMPSITGAMESIFGFGDHLPTITFHYDTETGMVESVEYSTYYSYSPYSDNEFLQMDMDALSTGEGEFLSRFSNFRTEVMEEEEVTKLSFDIDISTYFTYFDPHINLYFVRKEQDIEGYKNAVYYDCIDNYLDPKPAREEGEGFFYDQISCRRIEWED